MRDPHPEARLRHAAMRLILCLTFATATGAAQAQIPVVDPPGIPVFNLLEVAKQPNIPPEISALLQSSPETAEALRQLQADEYNRNKAEALKRARNYRPPLPNRAGSTMGHADQPSAHPSEPNAKHQSP